MNCVVDGCGGRAEKRGWCSMHYARWKRTGQVGGPEKMKEPNSHIPFLQSLVGHSGEDCVTWPYAKGDGYGQLTTKALGTIKANRLMCIFAHGEPPTPDHQAAHSCGNGKRGCVNPNHLSWKTPKENSQDKIMHGTSGRGAKNAQAKLTEIQVLEIKARLRDGKRGIGRLLAKEFGVCPSQISMINKGIKWGWLE